MAQELFANYAVGIDLGTTNSVIAYSRLDSPGVQLLPIPQIVAPGTVETRHQLPSFLYLAGETEAPNLVLPWAPDGLDFAVGEFARRQSADQPARTIAAAKSWLCHSRVDRHQPILPWGAPPEVPKISPVEASRRYLAHLVATWDHAFPEAPLAQQEVVLTVPASFDAAARDLTREAALEAGLPQDFVLIEEPQAAVYAWLADAGDSWRKQLREGDTLLVCDIGGGTTDFTLVGAASENGELVLKRIAVGNHILAGGDNMDLALAYSAQQKFSEKGVEVDAWQAVGLWHACRAAKEALLAADGPEKYPVTVLGRGRRLVGGTISVDLDRAQVSALLVEGFFPKCDIDAQPSRRRASGFRELGLPFETDTAITHHMAHFLSQNSDGGTVKPTHLLFNGGVLKSAALQSRLREVLGSWLEAPPRLLLSGTHAELDYAVARGAAFYAATKRGKGVRIRGGTARSYYVGIETSGPAIPGAPRPLRALCVAPFGMEEGTEMEVPSDEIGLIVGEPASFRFFNSTIRKQDKPGDVLARWTEDELVESDSLETVLESAKDSEDGFVPVRFVSKLTELGVLEFWCESTISDERWKLEFNVRASA